MDDLRPKLTKYLTDWLDKFVPGQADLLFHLAVVLWIALSAFCLHFLIHRVFLRIISKFQLLDLEGTWINDLKTRKFFQHLVFIIQCAIVQIQADAWLGSASSWTKAINTLSDILILFFGLMAIFSVLDAGQARMSRRDFKLQVPLSGIIQTTKLILSFLCALTGIALLLGKSPVILLSGLGALSAVLMLIFRDPILGLVAGIQLSMNDMLKVGDWLEMPKYNADGDVIDIGLTTVKVQNWDKTITTVPTYALISDSFKNWRGMADSGGRRIKRSVLINASSIRFLQLEDLNRLKKSSLLGEYLTQKLDEIDRSNAEMKVDFSSLTNGRRLTNIGTFRNYLLKYLKNHPDIHQDMTLIVRQLEPTSRGLPMEIYVFTNTTAWAAYESIQSDIFDHIFATLPEFDLRPHESPIGEDFRSLVR